MGKTIFPVSAVLAASLIGAATAAMTSTAAGREQEKCYGVALKGQNDCATVTGLHCAGTSTVDYQGDSWKLVPKGTCTAISTPFGPGSLTPIDRPA